MGKSMNEAHAAFIKEIVGSILKEEAPDELLLLDSVFPEILEMDCRDVQESESDEAYFGDDLSVLTPFLIDIVKDVVKDMIVAGIALTAKSFWDRSASSLARGRQKKKNHGRAKATEAVLRSSDRRANGASAKK